MKTMTFYLKIYWKLATQYLKERMQFRADFFMELIGMIFVNLISLVTIGIIFMTISEMGGWDFDHMLFLYGFTLMAMSPQQLLLDNGWTLYRHVVTGDFIKYCFRPVNILFYFMAETVDIKGFSQFAVGLIVIIISWTRLKVPVTLFNIAAFIIFMVGAAFICMGLIILTCTFGFMGGGTNAAMMLASDLKSYARFPVKIFGRVLQFIFTWIVPIGFIAYYPSCFLLKDEGGIPLVAYFSPIIGFLFFIISSKIWIHYANRYAGTGN